MVGAGQAGCGRGSLVFLHGQRPLAASRFSDEAVNEGQRKFMSTLQNTYAFFVLYANIDNFDPKDHPMDKVSLTLMDKWILSRLNSTIRDVDDNLSNYHIPEAAGPSPIWWTI